MSLDLLLERFNGSRAGDPVTIARTREGFDVVLSGDLDMKASSDLSPLLEAVLQECSAGSRLALDLSHVSYVASMGVGLLSTLMAKAERKAVNLVLVDIPPRVRQIMDVLGLLSFFVEERSPGKGGPA
jgi:anti-sigma B factor antagonist